MAQMQDFLRKINDVFSVNSQNHIIDTRTMQDTGQILNQDLYNQIINGTFNPYTVGTYTGGLKNSGGLGNMFAGLSGIRKKFGPDQSLLGKGLDLSALKNLGSDIRATKLFEGGPTLGGTAAAGMGIYQGANALKGLYDNMNNDTDLESLKDDINLQIASNPMYDMYMDAGDEKLLRKIQNGTLTNNWGGAASGAVQGIPKAALTALLGGVTGGVPGAVIGGLGSLVNSGIQGYGKGTQEAQGQLQGLYDRLRQANEEYRTMKRPSGLRQAGLSRQYYNQLY